MRWKGETCVTTAALKVLQKAEFHSFLNPGIKE